MRLRRSESTSRIEHMQPGARPSTACVSVLKISGSEAPCATSSRTRRSSPSTSEVLSRASLSFWVETRFLRVEASCRRATVQKAAQMIVENTHTTELDTTSAMVTGLAASRPASISVLMQGFSDMGPFHTRLPFELQLSATLLDLRGLSESAKPARLRSFCCPRFYSTAAGFFSRYCFQ